MASPNFQNFQLSWASRGLCQFAGGAYVEIHAMWAFDPTSRGEQHKQERGIPLIWINQIAYIPNGEAQV